MVQKTTARIFIGEIVMEITTSHGRMKSFSCRCPICRDNHGKEVTVEQHKKTIIRHIHRGIPHPAPKLRWNKKKGKLELTEKGSKILRWNYARN